MSFFLNLLAMMLGIGLFAGLGYWIKFIIKKTSPDLKYKIKYKLLRMKQKQKDIEMLMEDLENNVREEDLIKCLLLSGRAKPKKANELLFIYKEMKKVNNKDIELKGGELR